MPKSGPIATQARGTSPTGPHPRDLMLSVTERPNGFVVTNVDAVLALVDLFLKLRAALSRIDED
jgi:hypothetical protein